jgi:hypothetical protein
MKNLICGADVRAKFAIFPKDFSLFIVDLSFQSSPDDKNNICMFKSEGLNMFTHFLQEVERITHLQQLFQTKQIVEDRQCQTTCPKQPSHPHVQAQRQPNSSPLLFSSLSRILLHVGSNLQARRNHRVLLEQQIFPPIEKTLPSVFPRHPRLGKRITKISSSTNLIKASKQTSKAKDSWIVFTTKKNLSRLLFIRSDVTSNKKVRQPYIIWVLTSRSKLEPFLDVLVDKVVPQKRVANLVPSEELFKIVRRKLTME